MPSGSSVLPTLPCRGLRRNEPQDAGRNSAAWGRLRNAPAVATSGRHPAGRTARHRYPISGLCRCKRAKPRFITDRKRSAWRFAVIAMQHHAAQSNPAWDIAWRDANARCAADIGTSPLVHASRSRSKGRENQAEKIRSGKISSRTSGHNIRPEHQAYQEEKRTPPRQQRGGVASAHQNVTLQLLM